MRTLPYGKAFPSGSYVGRIATIRSWHQARIGYQDHRRSRFDHRRGGPDIAYRYAHVLINRLLPWAIQRGVTTLQVEPCKLALRGGAGHGIVAIRRIQVRIRIRNLTSSGPAAAATRTGGAGR